MAATGNDEEQQNHEFILCKNLQGLAKHEVFEKVCTFLKPLVLKLTGKELGFVPETFEAKKDDAGHISDGYESDK